MQAIRLRSYPLSRFPMPRQYPRLHQHLKPIADTNHRPAIGHKGGQRLAQPVRQVDRQQLTGPQMIAIREAAGDDQQRIVGQLRAALDHAIDVDALGSPAGQLDCGGGVLITIDAGRA